MQEGLQSSLEFILHIKRKTRMLIKAWEGDESKVKCGTIVVVPITSPEFIMGTFANEVEAVGFCARNNLVFTNKIGTHGTKSKRHWNPK